MFLLLVSGCAKPKRVVTTGSGAPTTSASSTTTPASGESPTTASQPLTEPEQATIGTAVASLAREQIGLPYRFGGESPVYGFDCSGLVQYVYGRQGVMLPRTVKGQVKHGRTISRGELRPGDLVFFRTSGRNVSHVGRYLGEGQFVHAPRNGQTVQKVSLDNPYWQPRFTLARRVP